MKFTISADVIKQGFQKVAKGLVEKTEYGKVIKLSAAKNTISLVTTNGETDYRWSYTNTDHFQTDKAGSVTLVAEKLLGGLDYFQGKVSFCLEDNLLKVSENKVHLEIKTTDIDIDVLPPVQPDIKFSFDSSAEISKIIHCMSDDPSKPKMLGVLLDLQTDGEKKTAVLKAVQPNRASKIEVNFESEEAITKKVTIPCFLARMMASERMLGLSIDQNTLIACFENYEVRTFLSDIPFMNPDSAFASSATKSVRYSRNELLKALRLMKATDKQNTVTKFIIDKDSTEITSFNEQTGKSRITVKSETDEKISISLNSKFLLELLNSLDGEDSIEFKTEGKIFSYQNNNLHFVTTVFGV
jgi:DNA polymerase III sliding clamp (beta) subunit (PCNA family)